ncbi:actinin alpha 2 [Geranomyces michiganensis]|nr:actinin alpha 2 [Geranomyces michiganensis]
MQTLHTADAPALGAEAVESPEFKGRELKRIQTEAQKRTFTKWCNLQLRKLGTDDQYKIVDLAHDLRDGVRLSLLLEVLSGEQLPKPERAGGAASGRAVSRIYSIVNVDKCLKFLAGKLREPLANIGSEDIVDGNLTLTLALVWLLILRFRLETASDGERSKPIESPAGTAMEVTDQPPSDVPEASPTAPMKPVIGGKATLLSWCNRMLAPYVDVGLLSVSANFSESWQSGIAFLCLVHTFDPALVPDITSTCRRLAASLRAKRSSTRTSRSASSSVNTAFAPPRAFSPDFTATPSEPRFADDEEWLKAAYSSPSPTRHNASPRSATRPNSLLISTTPTMRLSTASNPSSPLTPSPSPTGSMDPSERRKNLARAFALAEEHMHIVPLLDPQDIADVDKPDELIIMTYVSELYWVLKSRPFPAANMFRAELASSSQLSETDAYNRRLISTFLHHANRALAWVHKQQEATGALEGMLTHVPSSAVTKLIIPEKGWVKPIMEGLMYEESNFDRIKGSVDERIQFMHNQLRLANTAPPSQSPTWNREALIQLDDVAAASIVPTVHQLYREIQRVMREQPPTSDGRADHDAIMRKVDEKYTELKTRLAYFSDDYFPDRDVVLRAYLEWLENAARRVDSAQEELLGCDGKGGIREEIRRVKKQTVELELEITRLRADLNQLSSSEEARRAAIRMHAIRDVVFDQLGRGQTYAIFEETESASKDGATIEEEKQTPEALVAQLQKLAVYVDETLVQRVNQLQTRAAELVQRLTTDVVDRRASLPSNDRSQDLHEKVFRPRSGGVWAAKGGIAAVDISFNFLPAFLVWRGRGIIEATTEGILTYIPQSVTPLLTARQADISSLLHAAQHQCAAEEARDLPVRAAALEAAREYCQSVRSVDQTVKMWKDELAKWIQQGNARAGHQHDEDDAWVREAEKWCVERTTEIQRALQGSSTHAKRRSSQSSRAAQTSGLNSCEAISEIDAAWDMICGGRTSAGLGAFAVNPPHQFLRNAMSALLDAMSLFKSDALERVRETVQKNRAGLLSQWETAAAELEYALRSLDGDAETLASVNEAAQIALQNTIQFRQRTVEALLESKQLITALQIAETGLSAAHKDLTEVSAFIKSAADRCEAMESDASAFEQERWTPFEIHTESLLQSCVGDSEASNRIARRYTALKELLTAARGQRALAITSMQAQQKAVNQAYKWITSFLTFEQKWLIGAREAENNILAIDDEQTHLMAAMKTVLYNAAHGQVMGHEEALLLHESTARTLEQQISGRLSFTIDRITEEPRHWREEAAAPPELVRGAEAELNTGREAVIENVVKQLQEARTGAGGRFSTVRTRLALERMIGRFIRDSYALLSALKTRLDLERGVKVPHEIALSADPSPSVAAPAFLAELRSRETETARAIAAIKTLANECIDLSRRDGEVDFVVSTVESTMRDLQVLLDDIATVVREVSAAYESAALFAAKVGAPGRKIEEACREITAAVREVASVAANDREGFGAGISLSIVENIRVLAERAASLTLQIDDIERALDATDSRSEEYVEDLRHQVRIARMQTEEAGFKTLQTISSHWIDNIATKLNAWVLQIEEEIEHGTQDNGEEDLPVEYLEAMESALNDVNENIELLGPRLQSFEKATEDAIRAIREWHTRPIDNKWPDADRLKVAANSTSAEAIQARYVEIRARADSLPRAVREAQAFVSHLSTFVALAKEAEGVISELANRATDEGTEAQLADLERSVVNGELAGALDAVRSAAGYKDHSAVPKCTKRFEYVLDQIEKLRGTVLSSRQTRDAVQRYLGNAAEVRAWINNRLDNLEVVGKDVDAEAEKILLLIKSGAAPQVEEAVTQGAARSIEREAGLVAAEAALDRYNRAYEQLKSYAHTVIQTYGAADTQVTETVEQEQEVVDTQWRLMKERLRDLCRRVEWRRRALVWARRCETHVLTSMNSAIEKIAAGGDSATFGATSGAADPQLETVETMVEQLALALDEELRGWREQVSAVVGVLDELRIADDADNGREELLSSLSRYYTPRLHDYITLMETAIRGRQQASEDWAKQIRKFLSDIGECQPGIESAARELRERLYPKGNTGGGSTLRRSRNNLTRTGSRLSMASTSLLSLAGDELGASSSAGGLPFKHLVITGKDDVDKQHLDDWAARHQSVQDRLEGEIAQKLEVLQNHTAAKVIDDCKKINVHYARAFSRDIQDRLEELSAKWREATRLAHEEKFGIDRARKYHNWHSMLGRIETETAAIEDTVDGIHRTGKGTDTDMDELNIRLVASERAHSVFVRMIEQDKPQEPRDTQVDADDSNREGKAAGTLRKHRSLASLQSTTLAERESAGALKERSDALSARIARLALRILETRDDLGNKRRLMTKLEEISRLSGWCERKEVEITARGSGLPPQALLDDRPYSKSAEAQDLASASQIVHEGVQAGLKEAMMQNALMEYELGQSQATLLRLEEEMDPAIVAQVREKFRKIETLIAVEKTAIDVTKELYTLDRAMCSLTTWISAATAAASDISATQRNQHGRRQSVVLDEHAGDSEEDLAGRATYEEVAELEDRLRVYEETVTSFFNSAKLMSERLRSPVTPTLPSDRVLGASSVYEASVSWRTERVRAEWDALVALVGSLRGSSEDRRREIEFNEEVDEITRGLEYVQSLITSGSIAEKWDETEALLDKRMLPRVAALRRRSETAARDARERKRFLAKHQSLETWTKSLLEQVQARHASAEPALMDRRVVRLVEEIDSCIAEFNSIVQKAAAGAAAAAAMAEGIPLPASASSPTSPTPPPTSTDLTTLSFTLNHQTEHYEARMRQLLARLHEACEAAEDDSAVAPSVAKWEAARTWKMQVAKELTRLKGLEKSAESESEGPDTKARLPKRKVSIAGVAQSKDRSFSSKKPIAQSGALPARSGVTTRSRSASRERPGPPQPRSASKDRSGLNARSASNDRSAQRNVQRGSPSDGDPSPQPRIRRSVGDESQPSSPKRSQLPRPASSRSITPTNVQSSPARRDSEPESPSRVVGRTFTMLIPKPNHYTPDPAEPLDVAIARIVNAHESPIRIEKSNTEPGRYWFGEALRRLCFCRLVRQTVMVRIGGGWQELGTFLADHSALELRVPVVRSFSSPDHFSTSSGAAATSPSFATSSPYANAFHQPRTESLMVIELDANNKANPYALTSASKTAAYNRNPAVASPRGVVAETVIEK